MKELVNGCTKEIILEWQDRASKYDQVHSMMMSKNAFEFLDEYEHEGSVLYDFDFSYYLKNSEMFVFSWNYHNGSEMDAYLFTDCYHVMLVNTDHDGEWRELFGVIHIDQLWDYMDSLPNLMKRILPISRDL